MSLISHSFVTYCSINEPKDLFIIGSIDDDNDVVAVAATVTIECCCYTVVYFASYFCVIVVVAAVSIQYSTSVFLLFPGGFERHR